MTKKKITVSLPAVNGVIVPNEGEFALTAQRGGEGRYRFASRRRRKEGVGKNAKSHGKKSCCEEGDSARETTGGEESVTRKEIRRERKGGYSFGASRVKKEFILGVDESESLIANSKGEGKGLGEVRQRERDPRLQSKVRAQKSQVALGLSLEEIGT